jgi:dTMP kinase
MTHPYPGIFISLEGPDGAGKTTQLKLLSKHLELFGHRHIVTRDPGGTALGRQIRRILLKPENPVDPVTELLLYQADRAQHVNELIIPSLKAGLIVLCDRFIDSTIAYQGYGRALDLDLINELNQIATGGLLPQLTILFDIDSNSGLSRLHPSGQDRIEQESIDFHHRVREGYLKTASQDTQRWRTIDATKPMAVVQEQLRRLIFERFQISGLLEQSPLTESI